MENLSKIHNLSLNCTSDNELRECMIALGYSSIKTTLAAYPVTVLSIYYFEASKNDPENKLKDLLTKTYASRYMEVFGAA